MYREQRITQYFEAERPPELENMFWFFSRIDRGDTDPNCFGTEDYPWEIVDGLARYAQAFLLDDDESEFLPDLPKMRSEDEWLKLARAVTHKTVQDQLKKAWKREESRNNKKTGDGRSSYPAPTAGPT